MKTQVNEKMGSKKAWSAPTLIVHGSVEELTLQMKSKQIGSADDVTLSDGSHLSNLS